MADLNDKPFILCPVLEDQGIKVTTLWFKTQGGGQEGPVILLSGVPIGYDTALSANNFLQRPEGWLIDANDKSESFWTRIFGTINFIQKRPTALYEPKKIIFAVPPIEVKTIISSFSDETIAKLTKRESVIGLDRARNAQKDAVRGAVNCKGAWEIIKAACITRLENNPEDVVTFEYVWSTARSYSLNTSGVLNRISHESLLTKIVERRRLTAQMEAVIPNYYRLGRSQAFVSKADWKSRIIFTGSYPFGPMEAIKFSEVDLIAKYLIENQAKPVEDAQVINQIDERVTEHILEKNGVDDWADNISIPPIFENSQPTPKLVLSGDSMSRTTKPIPSPKRTGRLDIITTLPVHSVIERLIELQNIAERRVPFARVLCRHIVDIIVYGGDVDLLRSNFLEALESLIGVFASVIDEETLDKCFINHGESMKEAVVTLSTTPRIDAALSASLHDSAAAKSAIETLLIESKGEKTSWWWKGYTADRTLTARWELYRVSKKRCQKVAGIATENWPALDAVLHRQNRLSRIMVLRESRNAKHWHHVYQSVNGALLKLGDSYPSESEARVALDEMADAYLSIPSFPKLWTPDVALLTAAEAESLIAEIWATLKLEPTLATLDGLFELAETSRGTVAYFDQEEVSAVHPGGLIHVLSQCLYRYFSSIRSSSINNLEDLVFNGTGQADIDLDIEESLASDLQQYNAELSKYFGVVALQTLNDAIVSPSPEAEEACHALCLRGVDLQLAKPLMDLLRSISIMSAQYESHRKVSPLLKQKLETRSTSETAVAFVFAQYIGIRLLWSGKKLPRAIAGYLGGDCPGGELYLTGNLQLRAAMLVDALFAPLALKRIQLEPVSVEQIALI